MAEKEEDLILGEGEESELEFYDVDLHAEIQSASNALAAIETIDEQLLSNEKKKMIRAIRKKSLDIIHQNISDIYDDVFGREIKKEEENENSE